MHFLSLFAHAVLLSVWASAQETGEGTTTPSFEDPSKNDEFEKSIDHIQHPVCYCDDNVYLNQSCFADLKSAIASAHPESVIYLKGTFYVHESFNVTRNLNLYGVFCSSNSSVVPRFISFLRSQEDANKTQITEEPIFRLASDGFQTVRLRNLEFTTVDNSTLGPAIKAERLNGKEHWTSLDIRNCSFSNFINRLNGSAISLDVAYLVHIDNRTVFQNNKVEGFCDCYGGGALSADYVSDASVLNISATFINNEARFKYDWERKLLGSEHSEGGAIYFAYVDGRVNIDGNFYNNSGNDGGAITMTTVDQGYVVLEGHFENNSAVDGGAGARGGVIRIFNLSGTLELKGTYINNTAFGATEDAVKTSARGAVFAGNYLMPKSKVIVNGNFTANKTDKLGTIVSILGSRKDLRINGEVIVMGSSRFSNNTELDSNANAIIYIRGAGKVTEPEWKANKKKTMRFKSSGSTKTEANIAYC
ncbi:uncharacterized protein LOC135119911 [Zophobas morio]|uniref:uncharacterized protein LOC135119911 n=1 Tax=Zophobas morio TaxID=2755281 RepID=UPI0030829E9F